MNKQDDVFVREFGVVLGLLVVFAFVAYFLGTGIAESAQREAMATAEETRERIKPVGRVKVGPTETNVSARVEKTLPVKVATASSMSKPVAITASSEAKGRAVETLYKTVCMACHVTGIANAPKTGDKAAWEVRAAAGVEQLVSSVINGKGAMPPKAGNPSLTKEEITRLVKWFLQEAGVNAS